MLSNQKFGKYLGCERQFIVFIIDSSLLVVVETLGRHTIGNRKRRIFWQEVIP